MWGGAIPNAQSIRMGRPMSSDSALHERGISIIRAGLAFSRSWHSSCASSGNTDSVILHLLQFFIIFAAVMNSGDVISLNVEQRGAAWIACGDGISPLALRRLMLGGACSGRNRRHSWAFSRLRIYRPYHARLAHRWIGAVRNNRTSSARRLSYRLLYGILGSSRSNFVRSVFWYGASAVVELEPRRWRGSGAERLSRRTGGSRELIGYSHHPARDWHRCPRDRRSLRGRMKRFGGRATARLPGS